MAAATGQAPTVKVEEATALSRRPAAKPLAITVVVAGAAPSGSAMGAA